jgi:hypothetical protein
VVAIIAVVPGAILVALAVSPPRPRGRGIRAGVRVVRTGRIGASVVPAVIPRRAVIVTLLPAGAVGTLRSVTVVLPVCAWRVVSVIIPFLVVVPSVIVPFGRLVVAVIIPFGSLVVAVIIRSTIVTIVAVAVPVIPVTVPVLVAIIPVTVAILVAVIPVVAVLVAVITVTVAVTVVAISVATLAIGAFRSVRVKLWLRARLLLFFVPSILVAIFDGPGNPGAFACTLFHR